MNLRDAVDQFHRGYFATHRRSPHTQKAYAIDLKQFLAFIGEDRPLTGLRPDDLERWAAELKTRDYASASIRRKFATLRVFFNYWERREVLDRSPLRHIRLDLAPPKKLVRALSEEEIRRLLHQARRAYERQCQAATSATPHVGDPTFLSLRDLTIIEILFATGIRVGELVALQRTDYQQSEGAFLINGKGARQRLAFLSDPRSRNTLENYLDQRSHLSVDDAALFLNTWGTSISTQGVTKIVTTTAKQANIGRRVTPHMLRHTIARLLVINGANLRVVQEFLGHASIATTERYTLVTKGHLVRAIQKHHPNMS